MHCFFKHGGIEKTGSKSGRHALVKGKGKATDVALSIGYDVSLELCQSEVISFMNPESCSGIESIQFDRWTE